MSAFSHIEIFCLKYLLSVYFVPDIVTMTNKKKIKIINLSPITSTHQPLLFQPGNPHTFRGCDHFIWRCGFETVMGLGWVSPC